MGATRNSVLLLTALSTLGVTEEKQAPPNENPLENNKDNFLDGLE